MRRLTISLLFVFSLVAASCGDDGGGTVVLDGPSTGDDGISVDDTTGDGQDDCGQGRAFPDDPDFREAICRPLMAMVDLIGTDVEIQPEWNGRVTSAILNYDNRAEAMAELQAVLAEIEAAG